MAEHCFSLLVVSRLLDEGNWGRCGMENVGAEEG